MRCQHLFFSLFIRNTMKSSEWLRVLCIPLNPSKHKLTEKKGFPYPFGKYAQVHLLGCILQAASGLLVSFLRLIQTDSFLVFLNALVMTKYNPTSKVHTYSSTEGTRALEEICCPDDGLQKLMNLASAVFA